MKFTKLISLFLAVMLLVALFCSCDTGNNSNTSSPNTNSMSESEESAVSDWKYDPNLPAGFDDEGNDFVFLVVGGNDEAYHSVEIGAEELNNELINDAVYNRNLFVEEKLHTNIVCEYSMDIINLAINAISSNLDNYDVIMPFMNDAPTLALNSYIIPLNDIDTLQLDREWWDQKANAQLSINHKLFFTTGDISMLDNDCTQAIIFNLDMVESYSLESPYDMVKNKTWTIDKLQTLSKEVTQDNAAAYTDTWGFHVNGNGATGLYISSGMNIIAKDEITDLPILGITKEGAASVVERIRTLMTDSSSTIIIESYNGASQGDGFYNCYRAAAWAVANGKALFRYMSMSDTARMADYTQCNYGLLPSPMFDEDQESYASLVSTLAVPGVCVPTTNDDTDRIGYVLDAMAAKAKEVITYAYYDTLLKYRIAQDDESQEILDIIFAERSFDLGVIFNWGNCRGIVNSAAVSATATWTSTVDSNKESIQAAMQETVDKFVALG